MARQTREFDRRVRRLIKAHQAEDRGFIAAVTDDGTLIARPREAPRSVIPWRGMLFALAVGIGGKAFLYTQVGPVAYAAQIDAAREEGLVGRGVAWLADAGPATLWLAERIERLERPGG